MKHISFQSLLPVFYFFIAFSAAGLTATPSIAQNVYTVENVKVDISADSPLTAREQAFTQGQQIAFAALATSLGKEGGAQNISPEMLSTLIKDFEIVDEKVAPNRYAVTYIFRFKRNESDRYFSSYIASSPSQEPGAAHPGVGYDEYSDAPYGSEAPHMEHEQDYPVQDSGRPDYSALFADENSYTDTMNQRVLSGQPGHIPTPQQHQGQIQPHPQQQQHQTQPPQQTHSPVRNINDTVLLLPYWREGGDLALWGEQNAWSQTWRRLENVSDNQFVLPLGDLTDMQQIGDRLPEDTLALQKLFARYQVDEAVIAIGQQAPRSITTTLYRADEGGLHFWKVMDSPLGPASDVYSVAVGEVLKDMQTASPHDTYAQEPSPGSYQLNPHSEAAPYAPTDNVASPYYNYGRPTSENQPLIGQMKDQYIMVEGRFDNAQEWLQMKSLLDQVGGIGGIQIISLKPHSATMYMEISQSIDQIRQALAGYQLDLGQNPRVPASGGNREATYYLRFHMNGV